VASGSLSRASLEFKKERNSRNRGRRGRATMSSSCIECSFATTYRLQRLLWLPCSPWFPWQQKSGQQPSFQRKRVPSCLQRLSRSRPSWRQVPRLRQQSPSWLPNFENREKTRVRQLENRRVPLPPTSQGVENCDRALTLFEGAFSVLAFFDAGSFFAGFGSAGILFRLLPDFASGSASSSSSSAN
jgi:hypothetical protein